MSDEKYTGWLPDYDCKACGYKWQPRVENPKKCPRCQSRDWFKVRGKARNRPANAIRGDSTASAEIKPVG